MSDQLTPSQINSIAAELKIKYNTSDVSYVAHLPDTAVFIYPNMNIGIKIYINNKNQRKQIFFTKINP